MAPATLAGVRQHRRAAWDRDTVITAIQEWVATYGEPPRAADWNPSSAKWSGQLWRVERYRAGRVDGSPWPALNSAKRAFGGSLTAAIRAAGFAPAKPGPVRRSGVRPEQADRAVMSPQARAMLDAALEREREALRRAAALERQVDRVRERADVLAAERDAARKAARRVPKVVRERVVDDSAALRAARAVSRAEAKAAQAADAVAGARMDAAEARTTAQRLAARLERCEATVHALRAERRDLRSQLDEALAALDELWAARPEARPEVVVVHEPAPAAAELRAARRDAETAERRAAEAERELRATIAAIRGEPRRLTPDELAELRTAGPAGPAVLAAALTDLAAARKRGGEVRLRRALRRVAEAAVTWQERL